MHMADSVQLFLEKVYLEKTNYRQLYVNYLFILTNGPCDLTGSTLKRLLVIAILHVHL